MYVRSFVVLLLGLLGRILLSQFPNRPVDMIVWDDFSLDGSKLTDINPIINSGKDTEVLYRYANTFDKELARGHSNSFFYSDRNMVGSNISLIQNIKPNQVMEIGYESDRVIFFVPSFLFNINGQDTYTNKNILYVTTGVADVSILKIGDLDLDLDSIRGGKRYQVVLEYLQQHGIKDIDGDDIPFTTNILDNKVDMYDGVLGSDSLNIKFYINGTNLLSQVDIDGDFESQSGDTFTPQECNKLPSRDAPNTRGYYHTGDKTTSERSIGLYSTNREACIKYQDLQIPLQTNKTYLLAIDYKSVISGYIMITYNLSGSKEQKPVEAYFPISNQDRQTYTHFFTTNLLEPSISSISVSVVGRGEPVEVLFDNLRVYESSADMFGDIDVKISRSSSYISDDATIVEYNNNGKRYYKGVLHNLHDGVFLSMDRLYDKDFVLVPLKYDIEEVDVSDVYPVYRELVNKNYISVVGDKYISDLYDRGIINQNISKPSIYGDHLFYDSVRDELHYDGGGTNVRYVNIDELCVVGSELCKPNLDGSFDISFVIWKKVSWIWKLIYLGLIGVVWYMIVGRRLFGKGKGTKIT